MIFGISFIFYLMTGLLPFVSEDFYKISRSLRKTYPWIYHAWLGEIAFQRRYAIHGFPREERTLAYKSEAKSIVAAGLDIFDCVVLKIYSQLFLRKRRRIPIPYSPTCDQHARKNSEHLILSLPNLLHSYVPGFEFLILIMFSLFHLATDFFTLSEIFFPFFHSLAKEIHPIL